MGCNHLVDVADGGAEKEDRGPKNCSQSKIEAPECGDKAYGRKAGTCCGYLKLKWTVRPANSKKDMPR